MASACGRAYAFRAGDSAFVDALRLFIGEEQRHSAYLLRFMRREGIPAVSSHWVDTAFRWLRGLAGLELSLRVLVTAEIIAVPYYRALRDATKSSLLPAICTQILEDEADHLRFQPSMLARLGSWRSLALDFPVFSLHRGFVTGTTCVVWLTEHRKVFKAAGFDYWRLLKEALVEFDGMRNLSRELRMNGPQHAPAIRPERSALLLPSLSSFQTHPHARDTSYRSPGQG